MVNVHALEEHLRARHGLAFDWDAYGQDCDSPEAIHNRLHWAATDHERTDLSD